MIVVMALSGMASKFGAVSMKLTRRQAAKAAALAMPSALLSFKAFSASDAGEISRDAAAALRRLDATDHRAVTLGQKAAGILVFPKIVKAGFIFGAQGGKGVLTEHGHTSGYYSIAAASFGLQAGVQWFSYALFSGFASSEISRPERRLGGG